MLWVAFEAARIMLRSKPERSNVRLSIFRAERAGTQSPGRPLKAEAQALPNGRRAPEGQPLAASRGELEKLFHTCPRPSKMLTPPRCGEAKGRGDHLCTFGSRARAARRFLPYLAVVPLAIQEPGAVR
jgi:hypothetical protein